MASDNQLSAPVSLSLGMPQHLWAPPALYIVDVGAEGTGNRRVWKSRDPSPTRKNRSWKRKPWANFSTQLSSARLWPTLAQLWPNFGPTFLNPQPSFRPFSVSQCAAFMSQDRSGVPFYCCLKIEERDRLQTTETVSTTRISSSTVVFINMRQCNHH